MMAGCTSTAMPATAHVPVRARSAPYQSAPCKIVWCKTVRCKTVPRETGFTLIDLMITVAIVCILSAMAFPSYQEAMRKMRRAEAKAVLLQVMQEQERYYSQKGLYMPFVIGTENPDAKKFKTFSGTTARDSAYEISGIACPGESSRVCLTLVATPGTANVNARYADPVCGTLTLSTNGVKATLPETPQGKCW